jgi:malate dehydrogenase (oxaloacetate-decarboxylating)
MLVRIGECNSTFSSSLSYAKTECKAYNVVDALIYPGLGFGAMITQARTMTDTMIIAGTRRLASLAPALRDPDLPLLPDFADAPKVNYEVAVAVAEQAIKEGSAGVDWKKDEVREKIEEAQWVPEYPDYEYDSTASQD